MPVDIADSGTRIFPVADARARIRSQAEHPSALAETRMLVVEDARPLAKPQYVARHSADNPPRKREPWNPDPAWFEHEKTRELDAKYRPGVVAVPLTRRDPGATLPADAPAPARPTGLLAVLMRPLQWVCRDGGEGGS